MGDDRAGDVTVEDADVVLAEHAPPLGVEPICTASGHAGAIPADAMDCCKTCRKGKACGDTCIARNKKCTKPPGCACDAE